MGAYDNRRLREELQKDLIPTLGSELSVVQEMESFSWPELSGRYIRTLSDSSVKPEHSYLNTKFNVEMIVPETLGAICPTFEFSGGLIFSPPEKLNRKKLEKLLELDPSLEVTVGGITTPLGGKQLYCSDRILSYGNSAGKNINQKSLRIDFIDKTNIRNSVTLLYVEKSADGREVDSRLYLQYGDKLEEIDKNENSAVVGLVLSIDLMHTKFLKKGIARIEKYDYLNLPPSLPLPQAQ